MMEMVHDTCPHCDRFQTTNKGLAIITYGKLPFHMQKSFWDGPEISLCLYSVIIDRYVIRLKGEEGKRYG
jgi:hypothetical protein